MSDSTQTPGVTQTIRQKTSSTPPGAKPDNTEPPTADDAAGIKEQAAMPPVTETSVPVVALPVAAATPPAPTKPAVSHDASVVEGLLGDYTKTMDSKIITNKALSTGISLLARATKLVVDSLNDDARDVMWAYHLANKDGLMRENMGLRGIRNLEGKQAALVSLVYSMYRHKTTKSGMAIDSKRAIELTSRRLILYFDRKR